MPKPYAKKFYNSKEWLKCRESYIKTVFGLCERCGSGGHIVHHKMYLSESNINNPAITLNHNFLEYLCQDCHNKEHYDRDKLKPKINRTKSLRDGFKFNDAGELVKTEVFIVWGSPASGKTTYVKENKEYGDLVVDLDLIKQSISMDGKTEASDNLFNIAAGIREYIYGLIENMEVNCNNIWVVAGLPRLEDRQQLSKRLNAKLIHIDVSKSECISRAYGDGDRLDKQKQIRIINKWFNLYEC